jgi:TM2 domain-containing membrane protein YozV
MALLLSFLVTGAGQFYNGDRLRGLWLLAIYIAGAVGTVRYGYPIFFWIPFWIWGMTDARHGARRGNRALLDHLEAEIAAHKLPPLNTLPDSQNMHRGT